MRAIVFIKLHINAQCLCVRSCVYVYVVRNAWCAG